MQPGTPRFSEGETTSRPNIDTFGRYLIIFGRFFRGLSLRADSDPGGANFYIFVPSLGLPKITARDGSSSSTAEKKVVRRHGVRSLIVYSTYWLLQLYSSHYMKTCSLWLTRTAFLDSNKSSWCANNKTVVCTC